MGISESQIVFYATNSEGVTLTFWIGSDHFDRVEETVRQARKMELGDYEEITLTPEEPKDFYGLPFWGVNCRKNLAYSYSVLIHLLNLLKAYQRSQVLNY